MTRRVDPRTLAARLGTAAWPVVIDVRRAAAAEASARCLPAARWLDPGRMAEDLPAAAGRPVLVYCAHGHQLSQAAAALLVARGVEASVLEGGFAAWTAAGLPTIDRRAALALPQPSAWVTRERPKIDRVACPWLLRRFVDPGAVIHYVEAGQTLAVAAELGATAFDIAGAPLEHDGELCTFDTMIRHFGIDDPALAAVARIVRAADTHRFDLAPQAAGLLAVSLGLSQLHAADDHAMLAAALPVYDALYRWQRDAAGETHNWPAPA
ncbi:MAG: chromate resistance protein [Geminicoccaceae bacterium]